jgi:hypothetical protein
MRPKYSEPCGMRLFGDQARLPSAVWHRDERQEWLGWLSCIERHFVVISLQGVLLSADRREAHRKTKAHRPGNGARLLSPGIDLTERSTERRGSTDQGRSALTSSAFKEPDERTLTQCAGDIRSWRQGKVREWIHVLMIKWTYPRTLGYLYY